MEADTIVKIVCSLLAAVAMWFASRAAAGQAQGPGGGEIRGNMRLEVVTFPQDVRAGFKDLNEQALLYHPLEKPEGKLPLVILLHGAGGTRRDLSAFKWRGDVQRLIKLMKGKHVAKILVPQSRSLWDPASLNRMLDHILSTNPDVDEDRIYCIGYSMGGKGTWEWAMSSPERFAAIVPIAFIPDLSKLKQMVNLPIWAMVGTRDRRRAQAVARMEKALKELGSTALRTTVFEGANHASTDDKAWAQEGLLEWLFAQRRGK